MKILIVAMKYLPASGGSATYAHNLAMGLQGRGHEVMVLAPHYRRKMDESALSYRLRRMRGMGEWLVGIRVFIATVQIFRMYVRFRPDVLWATTYAGCRALAPLWFLRGIHIGTIHGGGLLRGQLTARWLSKIAHTMGVDFVRSADAVVTVSREAQNILRNYLDPKLIDEKTLIIYNGIHVPREKFVDKKSALLRWPELQNRTVLLTVGRLIRAKGHDLVLLALEKLRQRYPDLCYLIVGEGPERKNLETMADQLRIRECVRLTGYVCDEDLEHYYGLSDLFVMPGRPTREFIEGFGLVFLEAGVRGKPVVGTKVGGISEAVDHGRTGVVIEPDRPDVLERTLSELLNDRDRMRQMGSEGVSWVEKRFTLDVMTEHNDRLIRTLTQRKSVAMLLANPV